MRFKDIAWAAFLNWYVTGKDPKYVALFANKSLIYSLQERPSAVNATDFQEKVVSAFLNSWERMFIQEETGKEIHTAIIELNPYILAIRDDCLADCDLSCSTRVCNVIGIIYQRLSSIRGIDMTGTSKIAHILNDALFVLIDNEIQRKYKNTYGINKTAEGYINWMRVIQQQANEVIADFNGHGFTGLPERFLSQKLGYESRGCIKSLARFLDEYYWLTVTLGVPIPPPWIPDIE